MLLFFFLLTPVSPGWKTTHALYSIFWYWHRHFSAQRAADINDVWEMWFLTECCNIPPPRCNWGFHYDLLSAAPPFYYSVWVGSNFLITLYVYRRWKLMWAPGEYCVSCWSRRQSMVFSPLLFTCCSFSLSRGLSVCRCSSRRFSSTFLRRPQAPTTTSGWSYKPSLEYVQVCLGFLFVLMIMRQ